MNPTIDLIAAELPKHVDLILFEDVDDPVGGKYRRDTGGLTCSCGQWQEGPRFERYAEYRPREAFQQHVAEAILRRITQREHVDTLTAINERLIVPRIGSSYMREMDRDIITLRAAAATLTLLLSPEGAPEPEEPRSE